MYILLCITSWYLKLYQSVLADALSYMYMACSKNILMIEMTLASPKDHYIFLIAFLPSIPKLKLRLGKKDWGKKKL